LLDYDIRIIERDGVTDALGDNMRRITRQAS
jgi:hypothetical protein